MSKKIFTYTILSMLIFNITNVAFAAPHQEVGLGRVLSSLIFVIALIFITGWVYAKMKKINPEQLFSGKFNKLDENHFKIVASLQLGGGKAIYLIEINDKQLIVGTTSTNVNLLMQMDKTNDNKEIPKECINKLFDNKTEKINTLEE